LLTVGIVKGNINTHSNRKGVVSEIQNQTDTPGHDVVSKRGEWKGSVMNDTYMKQNTLAGQDRVCGRHCAGYSQTDDSHAFMSLPPHFHVDYVRTWTDEQWTTMLPCYRSYDSNFKTVIPYLLASVCYHWDFIMETLRDNNVNLRKHYLLKCPFVTSGSMARLREHVCAGVGYCSGHVGCRMRATGIPLAVINRKDIGDLAAVVQSEEETTRRYMYDLNEQVMATVEDVGHKLDELPVAVVAKITEEIQVTGIREVSRDYLNQVVTNALNEIREDIRNLGRRPRQQYDGEHDDGERDDGDDRYNDHGEDERHDEDDEDEPTYDLFNWTSAFNVCIPEQFYFPQCNLSDLFHLWFYGNFSYELNGQIKKLQPYKRIDPQFIHDREHANNKERFSNASCTMLFFLQCVCDPQNREVHEEDDQSGFAADFLSQHFPDTVIENTDTGRKLVSNMVTRLGRGHAGVMDLYRKWWSYLRRACHIQEDNNGYNALMYSSIYKHHIQKYSIYIVRRNKRNRH